MNDQSSPSGSTADDASEAAEEFSVDGGTARLDDPITEAERQGIVDQQGALIAEMDDDAQG